MRGELDTSVHPSSLAAYRSLIKPPTRWPYFVFAVIVLAIVCATLAHVAALARDVYFAHACAQVHDTWTGRECKPREETPPPAQHFTLELPPIPSEPDDERKPAPAPSGPKL